MRLIDMQQVSPVFIENQQQGSQTGKCVAQRLSEWDDVNKQIKGYASATSVNKGGSIPAYVTVNSAQTYMMDVYGMGWYPRPHKKFN